MTSRIRVALLSDDSVLCTALRLMITSAPDFYWVGEVSPEQPLANFYFPAKPHIFLIGGGENTTILNDVLQLRHHHPQSRFIALLNPAPPLPLTQIRLVRLDGCLFRSEVNESLLHGLRQLLQGGAWVSRAVHELSSALPSSQPALGLDDSDLTPTEKKVLALLRRGLENAPIAAELGIREQTVRNHVYHIYQKLGMNRLELVARTTQ